MNIRRESFGPDEIVIPPRLRDRLDGDTVTGLMASIEKIGLRTPITVRWDGEGDEARIVLVAGRHRLEACRRLGFQLVDCAVFAGTETEARLWEIAENLHRADLTDDERRVHLAEWVKLTAEKVSHVGHLPGGAQPTEMAIRKAARELNVPKSTVARAVAAESLKDEAKEVADNLGLGTVARATAARQATKEAQIVALHEADERRKANRETDKIVMERRLEAAKEYLAARLDVDEIHTFGEMIAGICDPLSKALLREAA